MSTTSDSVDVDLVTRQLSLADIDAIMEIEERAFTTPWRRSTFASLLSRKDTDVVGILRGPELVGYAVAWTIGDQAELGNVAVREEEKRRGLATRLIAEVVVRIANRGAREIFLEVRESNLGAQSLYRTGGFAVIGRRKNYYSRPVEDALVMRLDLS